MRGSTEDVPDKLRDRKLVKRLGYWTYRKVRDAMADTLGWRCTYCGCGVAHRPRGDRELATIDHIIPLAGGGTWKRFNLTIACKACNIAKADKDPEEFLLEIGLSLDEFLEMQGRTAPRLREELRRSIYGEKEDRSLDGHHSS